jgi:hypothetical protein
MANGLNTGTGFAAWTGVSGDFYYGSSGISGDACTTHDWGMYDSGGTTSAQRPFTNSGTLSVGQIVTVDMENGGINSPGSEGLSLWNSSGNNVWELYFPGGATYWTISAGSVSPASAIPYSGSGCRVLFTLTSSTTYSLTVQVPVGGTSYGPYTGTLLSPTGGQSITQLRFYTYDIGSGNNLQVGQMGVSCPTPTVTTQPGSTTVCSGSTASFTAASTTAASPTYQWQVSTNSGSSWNNVSSGTGGATASYTTAATTTSMNGYQYRCVVTDACGTSVNSSAATLTVNTPAGVTLNHTTDSICAGSTESVTATPSGGATGGNWTSSGTGSFSSTTADSTVYTPSTADVTAGTVTLTFTTTGQSSPCGAATATDVVTINPLPGSTITAPTAVCASSTGNTASVPAASGGTYGWTITGGTITAGSGTRSITFSANASGNVVLNCTVTSSAGCSSGGSQNTTISIGSPISTITAPSSVCASSTGNTASVPTASGGTYSWTISGGTITAGSGTSSITFSANASGNVVLNCTIVSSGGCSSGGSQNQTVLINALPGSAITAPSSVCANSTGNTASVPTTSGATYGWTISGGTITAGQTGSTVTFTAGASGSVTLNCTVTSSAGCSSGGSQNQTVTINALPGSAITAPSSVCASSAGNTASVPTTSGATYNWTITGGAITAGSGTSSIAFSANASGNVVLNCTVTSSAGCSSGGSQNQTVTISPTSVGGTVTAALTNLVTGLSTTITLSGYTGTIQWQSSTNGINFNNVSGATTATYTTPALTQTTYYQAVVTSGACSSANSSVATVTVSTSLAAPAITTQPQPQTVCSGSTATFTVAASGTPLSYAWYKHANAGWGSAWSASGSGGTFLGSSTGNNNGAANCNSFDSFGDINTPSGNSWGLYGSTSGGESVTRSFPATLTNGQVFQIDMDNGGVDTGVQNGFSLHNSSGAYLFSFYFLGGGSDYVYYDTSSHTTSVGYTVNGLRVQVIVGTGSPASYVLLITPCGGSTVQYSGVFATTGDPGQITLFNNNPYGGSANDLFFNSMYAGSAYDNADDYVASGNWSGFDKGDTTPISSGPTGTSYSTSTGSNGDLYYAIACNSAGDAASTNALLTVNAVPTAQTLTGTTPACSSAGSTIGLSSSQSGVTYQLYNGASTAGSAVSGTGSAISFGSQTAPGTYTVMATMTSGGCTANMTGSVVINSSPGITTASPLPPGTQNVAYNRSLASSGGSGSGYTYSQTGGNLPTGILLSLGGVLSGTPTVPGTYNFTVQVEDSNGCTGSTALTLVIACNVTISITPASLTPTVAASYSQQLSASGGQSPYTYAVLTGTLPAGLSLSSGGLISGTPTSDATANFTVQATDANGCPGTQSYTVTPACPAITVSGTPPAGTTGTTYSSTTFTGRGANGSYTFSKTSGALPTGLALSSGGVLSGTPTAAGTYNFTVTATDTSGCTGSKSASVTISCPTITVLPASLPTEVVNAAYTTTITSSGGSGASTFTVGSGLPTGLSLSTNGALSGTPTAAGAYSFTITATDTNGCTGSTAYTVTVTGAAPVITTNPQPQTVCSGSTATFTVAASGAGSYAWYKHANAGWGSAWTGTGSGTIFLGSSTDNNNGAPNCNSFDSLGDINTPSGNSWGLYGDATGESVARAFPAALTNGQIFQIDMDNGFVNTGLSVGFSLHNSSNANLFSFYFLGGGSDYVYYDGSGNNTTSVGYTVNGLRVRVIVGTGSPASYVLLITPCGGSTVEYSGAFATTGAPDSVLLYNNDTNGAGSEFNLYFNSIYAGSAYDNADNYVASGNWSGFDKGDASPISGATNASYSTSTGNNGDLYYAIAYNSAGDAASTTALLTINPLPTVSVNSATVCAGSSATLTATTTASSPGYLWSPGGAATASITVSPALTTAYTVTVTDGTTGCANNGSGTVTVNPLPTVNVNSATVCAGSPATLTATTSASSPRYLWSPGGGTTASITVSPASTTTYTVTVTDGTTGCANNGSGTVTVNPLPAVSVNSATVCAGSSATLTATTSAGSPRYLWNPGGGTTASITVSPVSTTAYTVTVTDGTTGCANNGSGTVTVNPLPTITLGASPILTYYSSTNASLPYTATSGSPDGYSITYDSTAQAAGFLNLALTSLPASPIRLTVPIAAGTNAYNGTLTVNYSSTGCSSTSHAFTVTVTNALSTNVVSSSANPADSGSSVTFTATLSTLAPSLAVPSGTVQFQIDGSPFGSPVTLTNGVAVSAGINSLSRGYHTNEADYAGDTNIVGSTNTLVEFIDTPPVAGLATFSRAQNLGLIIAISDLLANAADVYDDTLSLVAVSTNSTNGATIYTNISYIFYSPPAINGNVTDSFSYTVADTYGVTGTGTVMVTIQPAYNGPSVNITGISTNGNGTVTIGFAGIPGLNYLIQAATNLSPPITWTTLSTNMAGTNGLFNFTDLNATNYTSRYYRTATP